MSGLQPAAMTLAQVRKSRGFTLRDVEQITAGKVSNPYLSQLETGKIKNPSMRIVSALSAAYAMDVASLIDCIENPPAPTICPTCGQAIQ